MTKFKHYKQLKTGDKVYGIQLGQGYGYDGEPTRMIPVGIYTREVKLNAQREAEYDEERYCEADDYDKAGLYTFTIQVKGSGMFADLQELHQAVCRIFQVERAVDKETRPGEWVDAFNTYFDSYYELDPATRHRKAVWGMKCDLDRQVLELRKLREQYDKAVLVYKALDEQDPATYAG